MLSRRNIRIKVMQMLYTISRDKELNLEEATKRYQDSIQESYILYLYNLNYLVYISRYALKDAKRRSSKHLPTEEDKTFTPKLYDNEIMQAIVQDNAFADFVRTHRFDDYLDGDTVRKLYVEFSKTDTYKAYLAKETNADDHLKILLALFKFCSTNEIYNESVEDHYPTWVDDKSLVIGTVKKTLKGLPKQSNFLEIYKPTEETTVDFGEVLFKYVTTEDKKLLGIIEPALNNWDADRVAIIDMILLKMALAELIVFPTIPTKVTLNEFVEISKLYSTDKSKDFINGILDRLMKQLNKEGKIKKKGRGLMG
jgi:N utilization substance protein B